MSYLFNVKKNNLHFWDKPHLVMCHIFSDFFSIKSILVITLVTVGTYKDKLMLTLAGMVWVSPTSVPSCLGSNVTESLASGLGG